MRCRFKHKIFQNEENGYTIAIFTTQDTSVPLSARDKYLASRNIIGFSAIGFGLPLTDEIELEMEGSGQMPGYGSAPAASTPPKTGQMLQGALQNLDTSLPVEELMKHMNYEMAVGTVIPGKGKYGGKTMGQVAVESPSTIQWFAEQYSGPNNLVPVAAKVILQKAMPMAG
ncbi:MAG: hypothetical protein BHV88_23570 [Clostridiales bacterium 41_12_two_minus]|nr:MAG: hypothetical protein BHV88_23570 [Clostridiales bacterium 41_12_two_minus]